MDEKENDVVVPVVSEELHAGAVPVVTGGVRVTKRVHTHDEVLEQQLRRTHAEIKRVQTNRVVDGPQPTRRDGNTLIIPVVSEILRVEKQWVVTEEIHITQTEQLETVRQTVPVSREEAQVERTDESGDSVPAIEAEAKPPAPETRSRPASLVERTRAASAGASGSRRGTRSLLTKKTPGT
jgi:stress response protein YsnF